MKFTISIGYKPKKKPTRRVEERIEASCASACTTHINDKLASLEMTHGDPAVRWLKLKRGWA